MEKPTGDISGFASSLTSVNPGLASTSWLSLWDVDCSVGAWENFLLEATYSQARSFASHRLHLGRSPEHFVLWRWHSLHAFWARFLAVPASVRSLDGATLDTLPTKYGEKGVRCCPRPEVQR